MAGIIREVGKQHEQSFIEQAFPVAQLTALMANIHRDEKKRREPFSVSDFLPGLEPPKKKKQTPEEMLAMVKVLNAAFGGTVVEE